MIDTVITVVYEIQQDPVLSISLNSSHNILSLHLLYFSSACLLLVFEYAKLFAVFWQKFLLLALFFFLSWYFLVYFKTISNNFYICFFSFQFLILKYKLHKVGDYICLFFYSIPGTFCSVLRTYSELKTKDNNVCYWTRRELLIENFPVS